MDMSNFDYSHLVGASPIAAVILYVMLRIVKPLTEKFLGDLISAIQELNTTSTSLIETEQKRDAKIQAEHAEIIALLHVLTDGLLRLNGHLNGNDTEGEKTNDRRSSVFPSVTPKPVSNYQKYMKRED